jgi:small-conductance mechanosensitive channel
LTDFSSGTAARVRGGLRLARPFTGGAALALFALIVALASEARAQPSQIATVRLGETPAFSLTATLQGKPANERAAKAAEALAEVVRAPELPDVRVERSAEAATVYAGSTSIVELGLEDARLAGEPLEQYANRTAGSIRQALASEHKRSRIAGTVFSCSLVVFFALIAFYLIKQVTSVAQRMRLWLDAHGDRHFVISVKRIELVRPAVLKSTAVILLSLGKWLGQFGIFYAWLVVVLSLFESTRGYTERLTGFVLFPLSQLMGRAITALPLLVVAAFAALAMFVLLRFTGLFLASVARRETSLGWLPADLALPASVLIRIAIVVCALVFAAPIVTGSADGSLGRTGAILLVALGLAATPLFASGLLGAVVLFGRRLAVGEYIQIQGRLGRILSINLLELRLQTADGTEQRVPHLLLLSNTLERLGLAPRLSVEVVVSGEAAPLHVLQILGAAGARTGRDAAAELVSVESGGARYRLTATLSSLSGRSPLLQAVVEALAEAGISVGHALPRARPG